ncbi:flagellar export protein FliJ [Selenomonas sp.]|uniref:flagellar export protein FliJ n=1 Tax=Selenomonas sp. TaxID=2053611 RepID=UPI0025E207AF|nr:flagellar export protein FliJ [Selenomonas sp.]MCI6086399.1 flagellar export protein FliJ [Selenomonas sp.]MCI6283487.1 flagellar export protein FliJ [Selenomonas sp.]
MKKFKFQLETLLRVTRSKKEDAEVAFAEASRSLEEKRAVMQQLLEEMQRGQTEFESLTQAGKRVTVGKLMDFHNFFNWKREQIEIQQQIILTAKAERQKKLKELLDLMSYLKSIEQLREKRLQEYKDQALHEEQKMLDEIGLQLYMRNGKKDAV